jgi:acyl-coenzyme A synthetase/AMP-(fatty) acid ligase
MQLMKQIIFQARQREEEPAVASALNVVSYRALCNAVLAAVERLGDVRMGAGACVAIDVANPLHHLYLLIATGLLGLPSASVANHAGTTGSGVRTALLLTDSESSEAMAGETRRVDATWFAVDPAARPDYGRLLALPGYASADAVARYLFSSGTTGHPKCVAFTSGVLERRMLANLVILAGWHSLRAPTLNLMELSTISGNVSALRTLASGGLLCLARGIPAAIDMIRLFKVEYLMGSAGQLLAMVERLQGNQPLSSLRCVYVTGARIPLRLVPAMQALICPDIYCGYGSTEMGLMAVGTAAALRRAEGAVGYVVPGVELQAVDAAGEPLPAGEVGALRVRSGNAAFYMAPTGEPQDPEAEGWFYSGDMGCVHADGLLVITGRSGEVFNRGGVITAPDFLEDAFRADPRLRDVAAVGVTDGHGAEEVWVAVVADAPLDTTALLQQARGTLREKAPDRVFQVGAIPRNANAKIQRGVLRDQLLAIVAARRTGQGG